MLIILAASMTLASISGASEGGSSFKRQDKISNIFFSNSSNPVFDGDGGSA